MLITDGKSGSSTRVSCHNLRLWIILYGNLKDSTKSPCFVSRCDNPSRWSSPTITSTLWAVPRTSIIFAAIASSRCSTSGSLSASTRISTCLISPGFLFAMIFAIVGTGLSTVRRELCSALQRVGKRVFQTQFGPVFGLPPCLGVAEIRVGCR